MSSVGPLWVWLVFVRCVLNKLVPLPAQAEDRECEVWQKPSFWLGSYLVAITHCHCRGEEIPSSWKTKVISLPRDQHSHHLILQEERSTLTALLSRSSCIGIVLITKPVEERVAVYLLSFEHLYSLGWDSQMCSIAFLDSRQANDFQKY